MQSLASGFNQWNPFVIETQWKNKKGTILKCGCYADNKQTNHFTETMAFLIGAIKHT